jgi:hypothetical protein
METSSCRTASAEIARGIADIDQFATMGTAAAKSSVTSPR